MPTKTLARLINIENRNWMTPEEASTVWGEPINLVYAALKTDGKCGIKARRLYGKEKAGTYWAILKDQPKPDIRQAQKRRNREKARNEYLERYRNLEF